MTDKEKLIENIIVELKNLDSESLTSIENIVLNMLDEDALRSILNEAKTLGENQLKLDLSNLDGQNSNQKRL